MDRYRFKEIFHLMSRTLLGIVLAVFFLKACEIRPLPNAEDGEIRFELSARANNEKLEKKAGLNGQFLHTGFAKAEDLGIFWGEFGQEACIDCPDAFEIRFRDLELDVMADAVHMDSLLKIGERKFFVAAGVEGRRKKKVSFTNENRGSVNPTYSWDFGDGTISNLANPVHVYNDPDLNQVRVCLESIDENGCKTLICNDIMLEDSTCSLNFTHSLNPNSTYVEFEAFPVGIPPFEYRWDFGDGGVATLGNPGYFYPEVGEYEACLTVTDALGCSTRLCKNIAVDPNLCENNFAYQIGSSPSKDLLQLGRIELTYISPDGSIFSSSREEQPGNAHFEILDREPYQKNASGLNTYAFACRFSCTLWDEDGNSIEITDGESTSAVAYP
ncbi:MAG: PKD domain-containing protein [Bacteroidia bacterium]|nr:PKD domain-containing protein [Bacteroidia bacterium]